MIVAQLLSLSDKRMRCQAEFGGGVMSPWGRAIALPCKAAPGADFGRIICYFSAGGTTELDPGRKL